MTFDAQAGTTAALVRDSAAHSATIQDRSPREGAVADRGAKIVVRDLRFFYGESLALKNVSLKLETKKVTAFIGPSGCGKSTLLRVLNRMYDLYPRQRAEGEVLLDGQNILDPGMDLNLLRSRRSIRSPRPASRL